MFVSGAQSQGHTRGGGYRCTIRPSSSRLRRYACATNAPRHISGVLDKLCAKHTSLIYWLGSTKNVAVIVGWLSEDKDVSIAMSVINADRQLSRA